MDKQKLPSFANIQDEIQNILDTFDSPENDLTEYSTELNDAQKQELDDYLTLLAEQESDKVDGFGQYLLMQKKKMEDLKEESSRLAQRAKSIDNTCNYLKTRYLQIMEKHGLKKVQGKLYTLSRRCSKVVVIEDEKLLPQELWREKVTREPMRQDIKALLSVGKKVPGCRLGESVSLQVR